MSGKRFMSLSQEDSARLIQDIRSNARTLGPQLRNWIYDTIRIAELVKNENVDVIPIFWIRLYGILADISQHVGNRKRSCEQLSSNKAEFAQLALSLFNFESAIYQLMCSFNENELIYIQYRRHVDSHPFQNAYRIRASKGKLQDKVVHKFPEVELTVEETEQRIRELLNEYSVDEHVIAQRFAARSLSSLNEIYTHSLRCYPPTR